MAIQKIFTFTGFGFDVLLHNVDIKEAHGEKYPDININEIKILTAKELLKSRDRLSGKKLKFLRTFLNLSYQRLSDIIDVPASTIRVWEEKGSDLTGLSTSQERQFRVHAIDALLDLEKKHFEKQIIMTDFFEQPKADKPIDIGIERDYSYLKEA
jgi:DNA-binding transcriptional regulator YiaG